MQLAEREADVFVQFRFEMHIFKIFIALRNLLHLFVVSNFMLGWVTYPSCSSAAEPATAYTTTSAATSTASTNMVKHHQRNTNHNGWN